MALLPPYVGHVLRSHSWAPELIITILWQNINCNCWLTDWPYSRTLHNSIMFTGSCVLGLWWFIALVVEQVQTAEMLLSHCFGNVWGLWVAYVSKGLLHYIARWDCIAVSLIPTVKGYACFFYQLFLQFATTTLLPPNQPRCSHSPQQQLHAHTPWTGQAHSGSGSKSVGRGSLSPHGGVLWNMH